MKLNYIASKKYYELTEEEIGQLEESLKGIELELKNKIYIRFLFGANVKEALIK